MRTECCCRCCCSVCYHTAVASTVAAAAACCFCYSCCCLLMLFITVCRVATFAAYSLDVVPVFLFIQTRLTFNVSLGSTVAVTVPISMRPR